MGSIQMLWLLPSIKKYIDQEPPYFMRQICVLQWPGGDQNKEFRGNASFLIEKAKGWNKKIFFYCIFHVDQKAKNNMHSL